MTSQELRFGMSRKHGGDRVLEAARLFIDVLSARLSLRLKLVVSFDYEHLLKTVLGGGVEIAWLPPVLCAQVGSPVAVCSRAGRLTYRSAIVVRDDSALRVPTDLRGARVAWTDRYSSAGYIFPRQHLIKFGVDPRELKESFVGSFIQAAAAVDRGEADATATFVDRTDPVEMVAELRRVFGPKLSALRVLENGVTDSIPADGVAVSGRLPADQQARITAALCNLHLAKDGTAALQGLMQADCLVRPTPEVQRSIAALRSIVS